MSIDSTDIYDVLVIGTGVAGYAAGMYSARLGLKAIIVGETPGGTIVWTDKVENYPGFELISGYDLAEKLRLHAEANKVRIENARVESLSKENGFFVAKAKGLMIKSRTVIIATGTKHRKLEVPGATELEGKGIHYCALCDGGFYKGKIVGVVGGSDAAAIDGLVLSNLCKKVYIIYRGEKLRAEPINTEKLLSQKNVEVIYNTNVTKVLGKQHVSGVELDKEYKGSKTLALDGLFLAIGGIPQSELAKGLGAELNQKGEIKINRKSETNVPGLFAAGDVVDSHFKQAITGVAEAVIAAYSAFEFLKKG